MGIDETIMKYIELSDKVFVKKRHRVEMSSGKIQGRFDTAALEAAIKDLVKEKTGDEDTLLKDISNPCKVFVIEPSQLL